MKKRASIVVFLFLFIFSSCKFGVNEFFLRSSNVDSRSTEIKDIDLPQAIIDKKAYSVLLLADIHFSELTTSPGPVLFDWLNSLETEDMPDFCIVLGDMTNYGIESEYKMYDEFVQKIEEFDIEVYGILGNHDIYNSGWELWEEYVYPNTAYYRFNTPTYSWYFLDTANGTLGDAQCNNLIEELKLDPREKIVFSHYPLYRGGIFYFALLDSRERTKLIATFAKNDVLYYFAGHKHDGGYFDYGPFVEIGLKSFLNTEIEGVFKNNGHWAVLSVNEDLGMFSCDEYYADDLSVSSFF